MVGILIRVLIRPVWVLPTQKQILGRNVYFINKGALVT